MPAKCLHLAPLAPHRDIKQMANHPHVRAVFCTLLLSRFQRALFSRIHSSPTWIYIFLGFRRAETVFFFLLSLLSSRHALAPPAAAAVSGE